MRVIAVVALASILAFAQSKPAGAGHWEGVINTPERDLKIAVDLAQNDKGVWIGDMDVIDQGAKDIPVTDISVKDSKVSFVLKGAPGSPTFSGDLSPDGKVIKGEATQAGNTTTFELKWAGEPNVVLPKKSAPVAKTFEGAWEGAIETPDGNKLRLAVEIRNGADGASAILRSIDQGNAEIPVSAITQTGDALKLDVSAVNGSYEGKINKEGTEIAGTWTQGMFSAPLSLKKK